MKLEQQVASLGLSKRLKELGVKQESYFGWWQCKFLPMGGDDGYTVYPTNHEMPDGSPDYLECAAFTVAELGEMLPPIAKLSNGREHYLVTRKQLVGYQVGYEDKTTPLQFVEMREADARAKMLIYLIEQGIVNPKEDGK